MFLFHKKKTFGVELLMGIGIEKRKKDKRKCKISMLSAISCLKIVGIMNWKREARELK